MTTPDELNLWGKVKTASRSGGPIDLEHLSRQTLGDDSLAREVLNMFVEQTRGVDERLRSATPQERRDLAHALVGAARGIGAFQVAETAAKIEKEPDHADEISRLTVLLHETHDYIVASR